MSEFLKMSNYATTSIATTTDNVDCLTPACLNFSFFQTPDYQAKKKQCKELRQKLFHIKRLVKIYDQGLC